MGVSSLQIYAEDLKPKRKFQLILVAIFSGADKTEKYWSIVWIAVILT